MYPFRNILFPTDFTPHARAALKYAAAFARSGGGRVVLFSVQSARVPANLLTLPERIFAEQDNRWLLQLRTEVRELLADPLFNGLEVEPVIVEGEPATGDCQSGARIRHRSGNRCDAWAQRIVARALGFDGGRDYCRSAMSGADHSSAAT